MDTFLLSGKQGINIQEIQEFREIVKKLVAKSGIDVEFPKETQRLGMFDSLLLIFRILSILMGLFIAWILIIHIMSGGSWFGIVLTLLIFGVYPTCTYGLIIIIPVVVLYWEEQKQLRLELRTLIDIAEAAISVSKNQRCKSMRNEINHAEKLIEEYRKNKLSSNDGV